MMFTFAGLFATWNLSEADTEYIFHSVSVCDKKKKREIILVYAGEPNKSKLGGLTVFFLSCCKNILI